LYTYTDTIIYTLQLVLSLIVLKKSCVPMYGPLMSEYENGFLLKRVWIGSVIVVVV